MHYEIIHIAQHVTCIRNVPMAQPRQVRICYIDGIDSRSDEHWWHQANPWKFVKPPWCSFGRSPGRCTHAPGRDRHSSPKFEAPEAGSPVLAYRHGSKPEHK